MEKKFFTIRDLSDYTGWSKSYIYKKTSDGTLKHSKPLGKTIFFDRAWIDEFITSNQRLTKVEIELAANNHATLNPNQYGL